MRTLQLPQNRKKWFCQLFDVSKIFVSSLLGIIMQNKNCWYLSKKADQKKTCLIPLSDGNFINCIEIMLTYRQSKKFAQFCLCIGLRVEYSINHFYPVQKKNSACFYFFSIHWIPILIHCTKQIHVQTIIIKDNISFFLKKCFWKVNSKYGVKIDASETGTLSWKAQQHFDEPHGRNPLVNALYQAPRAQTWVASMVPCTECILVWREQLGERHISSTYRN